MFLRYNYVSFFRKPIVIHSAINATCQKPVQSDEQMPVFEDDHDGIGIPDCTDTNDPIDTNSHINTADEHVPQALNTAQELNMDGFVSDLELMDKLEYDGSSDSDAMDELNHVPYDFENSKYTDNSNETFIQNNEDESVIAPPHEIAISCQTREISTTEKFTNLKNTSRKRKIGKLYQDSDGSEPNIQVTRANRKKTYRKIRKNVYGKSVKPSKSAYTARCNCKEEDKCGDGCWNRMDLIECDSTCLCGSNCTNRVIQNGTVASIERFMTKNKGWGVKACEPIKSGKFVIEYIGEVVSASTFENRMKEDYKNNLHHYGLKISRDLLIDSHNMGNMSRYVNHSCRPNCTLQRWEVDGLPRMALFSLNDIEKGEEITFNYNFTTFKDAQKCKCGAKECIGYITSQSKSRQKTASKLNDYKNLVEVDWALI